MVFILAQVHDDDEFLKWRATCVLPEKTIDIFFVAANAAAAKAFVRGKYPAATFTC